MGVLVMKNDQKSMPELRKFYITSYAFLRSIMPFYALSRVTGPTTGQCTWALRTFYVMPNPLQGAKYSVFFFGGMTPPEKLILDVQIRIEKYMFMKN